MAECLFRTFGVTGAYRFFSEQRLKKMKKDLESARSEISENEFASAVVVISLLAFYLSFSVLFFILALEFAFSFSLLLSCIIFFILLSYPEKTARKYGQKIEKEIPVALRQMGIMSDMGVSFEESMVSITESYGELSGEFRKILKKIDSGISPVKALSESAESVNSIAYKKMINQLISIYREGEGKIKNSDVLFELAKEEASCQRAVAKQYVGKIAFYSLFFIGLAIIIPAIVESVIIVGTALLGFSFTPLQALLIPSLLFPSINLSFLVFMRSLKPEVLK